MSTRFVELSSDMQDLKRGQIVTRLDSNTWDQIRPRTHKVSDSVSLQIIFGKGKSLVRTTGPLYLLQTTYLYIELNRDGTIANQIKLNTEKGDKFNETELLSKRELHDDKANFKIDVYVQKHSRKNELIVFEMLLPLYQDVTRFCSVKSRSQIRESKYSPVLLGLLAYCFVLLFISYGNLNINMEDPVPLVLNTCAITSLTWYAYAELMIKGFWATMIVETSQKLQLTFKIEKSIGGKYQKEIISVKQLFDVHYLRIYFSEVALAEAIKRDPDELHTKLVLGLQKKYADANFLLENKKTEVETLEEKVKIQGQIIDKSKTDLKRVAREYFIRGHKLQNQDIFLPGPGISSDIFSPGLIKTIVYAIAASVILIIFTIYGLPAVTDIVDSLNMPELSLFWQITVILTLGIGVLLIVAVVIVKAWKAT